MGVEVSRAVEFDSDLINKFDIHSKLWTESKCKKNYNNNSHLNKATINDNSLIKAAQIISNYFKYNNMTDLNILEPYAGNGYASKIFKDELSKQFNVKMKSTDITNFNETSNENCHNVEFGINSYETVVKYNDDYDILLLNSVSPSNNYSDFFCINKWLENSNSKYLIFNGELGASDGSEGLYHYLLTTCSNVLKLRCRGVYYNFTIFGDKCDKEVFIFKKIENIN